MRNITTWFEIVDRVSREDNRKTSNHLSAKSQKQLDMSVVYTLDGGCTVIEPPASIWLNKQGLNRVQT